jgi:rhodanese-related sulfurtransferase
MAVGAKRISPQEAKEHLKSGALLVCAYDSEAKFRQNHLEGAISLDEFKAREGSTPRDREVIFYCA